MPGEQLDRAIALIKSGQKESAQVLLSQLVQAEPANAAAWLWLVETMPDDRQRIAVLEACLQQNPQSRMVQRGLERLRSRQVSTDKPSVEAVPTVPIPPPAPPETISPLPLPPVQPEQTTSPRQPLAESPTQPLPSDDMPGDDIDSLRQALTGKTRIPKARRVPVKPTRAEIDVPAAMEAQDLEPGESLTELIARTAGKPGMARKQSVRQRGQSLTSWLALVLLGLLAAGVVGVTGYIMRDQLIAWLGLPGGQNSQRIGNALLTPGGENLASQTSLTPLLPTSTLTPTPTITPVPTPTATVAYTFPYAPIAPENGDLVVQVGDLSSIPALCVAISSDNRLLAAGLDDSTVMVWDLTSGKTLQIFQGHTQPVNAVDFSPNSRLVVSGSEDGSVRVWDVYAGTLMYTLFWQSSAVKSVAFSPDGNTFASGTQDGNIDLWRLGANTPERVLPAGATIQSLDYSPDGRLLAVGLQTGTIQVLNTVDGTLLNTLPSSGGAAYSVAFAPSGHRLAVGSQDQTVRLWDVDRGKVLYTVGTHTEPVVSVCFSPDGRVLASASLGQTIKLWDVAERREIASLRHARNMPGIAFSPDGRVLAAALSPTNSDSREGGVALWGILFNPEVTPAPEALTLDALQMSKWISGARMATSHVAHQAIPITGERVLIIGGGVVDDPDSFTNKTELYNPSSGSSILTGAMKVSRGLFSATLLRDGRVLVIGGYNPNQKWVASAEIYDPISGAWSLSEPLFNHGIGHTAILLSDGRVLVAGGCMGDGPPGRSDRAELFDPATNSWTETNAMGQSRCDHIAVLLDNGRVLVAGGEDGVSDLTSAEVFDPVTGHWSKTGDMISARREAVAVRLADGRVMVTGGLARVGNSLDTLDSVEIYDTGLGAWSPAAPMSHARYGHTAELLPGGLVLVVGGLAGTEADPDMFLTSVEVYNPDEGDWVPIASLTVPRAFHTTTLMPDGHIFVMGGMSAAGSFLANTEILVESRPVIEDTPTAAVESTLEPAITPGIEVTTTPTGTLSLEISVTPTSALGGVVLSQRP